MQKLILHLPKHRLIMQFRIAKKRKSSLDESLIPTRKVLNLKYRVGGLTRKFFRHVFEHKSVKRLLGTSLVLVLIMSSFVPAGSPILASGEATKEIDVVKSESPIYTNVAIRNPVENISVTQKFGFFHSGLDLDGITGDTIKPMKKGVVESVIFSNVGYGKHVIINHGDGLMTLYAHLSKIDVKVGQEVDVFTKIGEMGATGHSFGDHLHFEVRDHGITVNPARVIPL